MIILDLAYLEVVTETSIVGGANEAIARSVANALGRNTQVLTQTKTAVIQGVGSRSESISVATAS
jgi:hypothetical protein